MSVVQHSYVEAKTEIKECTSDVSADDQHHTSNEKKNYCCQCHQLVWKCKPICFRACLYSTC